MKKGRPFSLSPCERGLGRRVLLHHWVQVEAELEELDLEVEDLSLLLEELSLFLVAVCDSPFDSDAFAPVAPLESPFWLWRA